MEALASVLQACVEEEAHGGETHVPVNIKAGLGLIPAFSFIF